MNQVSLGSEKSSVCRVDLSLGEGFKETSRLRLGSCSCGICERNRVGGG